MKRPPFAHTDAASEHQAHVEREAVESNARVFLERREREELARQRESVEPPDGVWGEYSYEVAE